MLVQSWTWKIRVTSNKNNNKNVPTYLDIYQGTKFTELNYKTLLLLATSPI